MDDLLVAVAIVGIVGGLLGVGAYFLERKYVDVVIKAPRAAGLSRDRRPLRVDRRTQADRRPVTGRVWSNSDDCDV